MNSPGKSGAIFVFIPILRKTNFSGIAKFYPRERVGDSISVWLFSPDIGVFVPGKFDLDYLSACQAFSLGFKGDVVKSVARGDAFKGGLFNDSGDSLAQMPLIKGPALFLAQFSEKPGPAAFVAWGDMIIHPCGDSAEAFGIGKDVKVVQGKILD